MAYPVDGDFPPLVVDHENDAVTSLADPVPIVVAGELLGTRWSRIRHQRMNALNNSNTVTFAAYGFQLLRG
jgi:hypothetical protein